jgi:hypothetical protein
MDNTQLGELFSQFPSLIPLNGKIPREPNWQQYCEKTRRFNADDFKDSNVGIPCGPANGVLVLDVDNIEAFNHLLKEKGWTVPTTLVHRTGREGMHYFYAYPKDGKRYGNKSYRENGKSIFDIRGIGGQVVAPGSIHPETGKPYEVILENDIAPAPQWLLDFAVQEEIHKDQTQERASTWDGDLKKLSIDLPTRHLIRNGANKPERSEAVFSVIQKLLRADVSDKQIISIFEAHREGIGEKYFEKGKGRERWLLDDISRARAKLLAAQGYNTKPKGLTQERKPRFLNVGAMEKEFGKQTEMLWKDLIPKANPSLFGGAPGVGKSSNVAQMCKEIVLSDRDTWVLWVATEGFVSDHADKWRKLNIPERVVMLSDDKGVYKLQLDNWKDRNFLDQSIEALMTQTGGRVVAVVIDSIRGMQSMGENDPKLSGVMSAINSIICDKHKAAAIYIAHHKKGREEIRLNRVAGSTGITSSVRGVYAVERISEFVCRIIPDKSNTLGHNPKSYKSVLVQDDDGYEISIVEDVIQDDETAKSKAEKFLISLFKEQTEYLATEIYRLGAIEDLSSDVLKKAKANLPIKVIHEAVGAPWIWRCDLYKQNLSPLGKTEKTEEKKPNKINKGDKKDKNLGINPKRAQGGQERQERQEGFEKNSWLSSNKHNESNKLCNHPKGYSENIRAEDIPQEGIAF